MRVGRQAIWVVIAVVLLGAARQGSAGWIKWDAVSGSWADGANWEGGSVPVAGSQPIVDNSGVATIDSAVGGYQRLIVGSESGKTGTVVVTSSGSVTGTTWNYQAIGRAGVGTVIMNGGTWNGSKKTFYLGEESGGDGTWTMNGGVFSNFTMNIGNNDSQGRFELLGATARVEGITSDLNVGYTNNANCTGYQTNGT